MLLQAVRPETTSGIADTTRHMADLCMLSCALDFIFLHALGGMSLVPTSIARRLQTHLLCTSTLHYRCSCVHGTQVPPQTVSRTQAVIPAYSMLFLGPKHI